MAEASGIAVLRTAYRAPKQIATCERFLGSVRRECLDHVLVLGEMHLRRVLREYVAYFNAARPHQGLQQGIPASTEGAAHRSQSGGQVQAVPVLGGLHHTYRRGVSADELRGMRKPARTMAQPQATALDPELTAPAEYVIRARELVAPNLDRSASPRQP